MNLRLKILLILAIACAVGDAFFLLLWHPWQTRQLIERERIALQEHLVTLGDAVTPFLLQNQIGAIYEGLDATLERQPTWKSLVLTDSAGDSLYPLDPQPLVQAEQIQKLQHDITLRNARLGRLELQADLSPLMTAQRRSTWSFVALTTLGFLATGLLIVSLLEAILGRRARQLADAVQRLTEDDYTAELPMDSDDEIGRVARAFANMRAVIQSKEKALVQSRQAAEAANEAKSMFLATMSHEIRTPMNGILGMAQLLQLADLTDSEREEYVQTILNSGKTLLTLLNDILDLSKVEAGKIELLPASFSADALVNELSALFAEPASSKSLQLQGSWQGPAGQHYLADVTRLRQMISNLLSNAIKFTAEGSVRLEMRELQRTNQQALLEFSVTDTGTGIAPEQLSRLFNPFIQVDGSNTRQFGGTGLGLSIIKSLARLMEGEVGVSSEPGRGSRFWFTARAGLLAAGAEPSTTKAVPAVVDRATASPDPLDIMVVEDNATNRKVITALVKKLGHQITLFGDGAQAVEAIRNGLRPSLILMDVQMPVMDGLTATRLIREYEAATHLRRHPVIALTAGAFEEDHQRCQEAGMDHFLTKPININLLRATLKDLLPP